MKVEDLLDSIRAIVSSYLLVKVLLLIECGLNSLGECLLLLCTWGSLWNVVKIVAHLEGIFKRSESAVARVGKLWMVLVHLVNWAWTLINFW